MISLFLSVCLAGQPCKDERVADFFSPLAENMCDVNKFSMQHSADTEKRAGVFVCRTNVRTPRAALTARLDFTSCVNSVCDKVKLADFYGDAGQPLCQRNNAYYFPVLDESAKGTNATIIMECVVLEGI